ncbi:beta-ketoacyl synthase N-terminal-like domain-containing protein [Geobacter sp. DSM 9736]|uniref:beta-ketoacyl synthase N-terminal-like domain-containing protein n=1 Tax=Geobacter sp. DSM 9736 TaxID=1277350 RepID=UPI000B5FFE4A|nr:beta-ketoacyl synthase N-terminal-like domain-containing protein [Geobacter sp. DSM 9736]SNB46801.1 PfaB family protein [Geobacter sp. DSM 9736]
MMPAGSTAGNAGGEVREAIAVVGIGAVFPGSPDLDRFWNIIARATSTARIVPQGRWAVPPGEVFDPSVGRLDRVYSRTGCFIEGLPPFDGSDLGLEAGLLGRLDPLFHLLLHAGHRAWGDAVTAPLDRSRVGIIIGNLALPSEYASALSREILGGALAEKVIGTASAAGSVHLLNRHVTGFPAALLATSLGLGGGSYTLDAACASSLYAIKLAMDELLSGRADAMLTGGLSRPDPLYTQMGFSQLRALSPTGTCSPFDARGDGLVVGEGAGIFVLKRLSDALSAGDRIYGVIRGIGLSNDVGGSLLAPNSEGQLRAMEAAYQQAGWNPNDVDHVECHATGTPVGDAVEFASLRALWGKDGWRGNECVIGSVKSNIGHLLTAAGAAALIKTLLAMHHEILPPTANFTTPAPGIDLDDGPFRILTAAERWERRHPDTSRRAAVSAFGFGGINAHLLIEEWRDPSHFVPAPASLRPGTQGAAALPVAVVGIDARFGPWQSLQKFQHRVLGGGDDSPAPPRRWWGVDESGWYRALNTGRRITGYWVDEVAIPAGKFRIPPKEMEEMLPQQALMLLSAEAALADAGSAGDNERTGAFIGLSLDPNTTNFTLRWTMSDKAREWAQHLGLDLSEDELADWTEKLRNAAGPPLTANRTMGALASIAASRIAREFRLGGPAFTISAGEHSGIRALEAAVHALQQGEVDRALAGAVDFTGDVRAALAGQASITGRETDESIAGEGAVSLVLKRLEDAERDGDRIYAVIKGLGSATACDSAFDRACHDADITPGSVGYVEVGGTLPDTVAASLSAGSVCTFGDLKERIGDSGAAAGLASVARALLCLYRKMLPAAASAGPKAPQAPARLSTTPSYWLHNRACGPRRAAVCSPGTEGSWRHIILEELESSSESLHERTLPWGFPAEAIFAVTANSPGELAATAKRLRSMAAVGEDLTGLGRQWLKTHPNEASHPLALALVARSRGELIEQLDYALHSLEHEPQRRLGDNGRSPAVRDRVFYSPLPLGPRGTVAFVFPGSGNHYPGMGKELFCRWPSVLRAQEESNLFLRDQFQPDLFWNGRDPDEIHRDHNALIFGQVALGTAVSDIVRQFGVNPGAVVSYSLGESAGLFSLGAWKDRDLMLQRMLDSTLFTHDLAGECRAAREVWGLSPDAPLEWVVGVVDRPAVEVRQALASIGQAYLLIVNTPSECVVGGNRPAVETLVQRLECRFYPISGVTTVHCEVARPVAQAYHDLHLFETSPPQGVTFYSGAWGRAYDVTRESAAESILAQALHGIDFPKTVEAAYGDGARVFLEMGPGASCSRMISAILADRPHVARSACFAGQDPVSTVLRMLAQLVAERVPVNLEKLYGAGDTAETAPEQPQITLRPGGEPFRAAVPSPQRITLPAPAEQVPAASPCPAPAAERASLAVRIVELQDATRQAHEAYLRFSARITEAIAQALSHQMGMVETLPAEYVADIPAAPDYHAPPPSSAPPPVAFDRNMCMEFAVGSVAAMLGPEFAEADTFPTRVRLPDEPLMLVDRIMLIDAVPRSMGSGRVVTEHDILPGAWYLDGGRIPTCIAVEAGQADLFLSGYLGIDFITRGKAVYRLLDAVVTFHRELPRPGETISYDIRIESFFRQDSTYLFRFNFEGTVNGEPLLTMRDGCAGFFTEAELAAGKGIVHTKLDLLPRPGIRPDDWRQPVPMGVESYDASQLEALRRGDLAGCFGALFAGLPLHAPLTIPGGRMKLVDRVVHLDPTGGRFGLGLVRAEADIDPAAWFLTCHFVDDQVMPGTLMYECCLHTLRIYLLRMGWIGEAAETACEPVPGVASQLKCRGQVTAATRTVTYEISLREIGYRPEPYVIVDALMYADGKAIVEITNMSARLSGLSREKVEALWQRNPQTAIPSRPLFDYDRILAFATGNPSEAFGEPYRVFDEKRVIARLPGPPFQFLDRIVELDAEPWVMKAGGVAVAEYDVPADAWYFRENRQPLMPFSVLLEIALQPCGWLAAYIGSALTSDTDLHFRNLGGTAVQLLPVTAETGTLRTTAKITKVAASGGMIIQNYEFSVESSIGTVYRGDTVFGFFSADALARQVGITNANPWRPSAEEEAGWRTLHFPTAAPYPDTMLRMIGKIDCLLPQGGPHRLGYVRGSKHVDPEEWFFKAHFYQDPVCPGSLGLESFLQLLKLLALEKWNGGPASVLQTVELGRKHAWTYRGQIIPANREVVVEAVVTSVDDETRTLTADGFLSVDGKVIYEMKDFTLKLENALKGDITPQ